MKKVSEKTKALQHRGEGIKENYIPYIKTREFMRGSGTRVELPCWKFPRTMHLLSQGEYYAALLFLWDDRVTDLREQYPLNLDETNAIAKDLDYRPANNGVTRMTTDFVVTYNNDYEHLHAFNFKASSKAFDNRRTAEKFEIESRYWEKHNCTLQKITKEELDIQKAIHIAYITRWIHPSAVRPENNFDIIKYMIANKLIVTDMSVEFIDYPSLIRQHSAQINNLREVIWKR